MEKILLIGNLGADATVQDWQGNRFLSFRIGCSRKFTSNGQAVNVTTWYDCTYNNADTKVLPYLKKGVKVFVTGQPTYRIYDSAVHHAKMVGVSVFVNEIELCGSASDNNNQNSTAPSSQPDPNQSNEERKAAASVSQDGERELDENGNPLPF